jgi:Rrf2 family protein
MKISRSTGYALIAVGYIAKNSGDGAILAAKISSEYNIPLEYLLKILQQLVRSDVLQSKRGPRGGFYLSRSRADTTLLDIVEAVEGPMTDNFEISTQANGADFCKKIEAICRTATNHVKRVYEEASLEDILDEAE